MKKLYLEPSFEVSKFLFENTLNDDDSTDDIDYDSVFGVSQEVTLPPPVGGDGGW